MKKADPVFAFLCLLLSWIASQAYLSASTLEQKALVLMLSGSIISLSILSEYLITPKHGEKV